MIAFVSPALLLEVQPPPATPPWEILALSGILALVVWFFVGRKRRIRPQVRVGQSVELSSGAIVDVVAVDDRGIVVRAEGELVVEPDWIVRIR